MLSGRRLPQLPLARLRAEGRLLEIGVDGRAVEARDRDASAPGRGSAAAAGRDGSWETARRLARRTVPRRPLDSQRHAARDARRQRRLSRRLPRDRAPLRSHRRTEALREERRGAGRADPRGVRRAPRTPRLERAARGTRERRRGRGDRPPPPALPLPAHRPGRPPRRARAGRAGASPRAAPRRGRPCGRAGIAWGADIGHRSGRRSGRAARRSRRLELRTRRPTCSSRRSCCFASPSESYPDLCLAASWLHAVRGRAPDAQHWGDATLRGLPGADARVHVLQALRCRDGADQMLDDTTAACGALPPGASWRPAALLAHGVALLLAGDAARASRAARTDGRDCRCGAADRRPLLPCAARHRRRRPSRRGRIRGRSCCGRSRQSAGQVSRGAARGGGRSAERGPPRRDRRGDSRAGASRAAPRLSHARSSLARALALQLDDVWVTFAVVEGVRVFLLRVA